MKARENPFSSERVDSLDYRLSINDWSALLKKLSVQNNRGAIVGPHGSGKTTLLENLIPILKEKGFEIALATFAPRNKPLHGSLMRSLLEQVGPRTIICVDGAEQLSAWRRMQLKLKTRKSAGLIITAHDEGLLPTLFVCRPSIGTVEELVEELVGEEAKALKPQIEKLYQKSDGNVRTVLRDLYDEYAKQERLKH